MSDNRINVCIACDDNYSRYAGVVIASILSNADTKDELYFYILDGGITDENIRLIANLKRIKDCEINFIKVDNSLFDEYSKIKTNKYISLPGYYRLKIQELLPNINKVIYLDCDVVVNRSLKELFDTDLEGFPIGGVLDINKRMLKKNPNYVNAGVLLIDIENIRHSTFEQKALEWTKEHAQTIKMGDQEIINEVLKGNIKILKDNWNVQSSNFVNRSSYTHHPYIIHYVSSRKPWHFGSFSYHKKFYFDYLQLTDWKLSEEEKVYWYKKNKIASFFGYIKYRPLFFLRPRFWQAVYYTYIKKD